MAKLPQESPKRCTSCGEMLPAPAFNRRTKSPDGRASACRRCASLKRQSRTTPRQQNEMRAAIRLGDFDQFRRLFPDTSVLFDELLAMATQNYNTAKKHAGHTKIVEFLLKQGAKPTLGRLLEAARDGSRDVMELLLAAAIERDVFIGSLTGDVGVIKKLLRRDVQLAEARMSNDVERYRHSTPLHCCCLSTLGRDSAARESQFLEVAQLLVASGAQVNAESSFYGFTVTPLDLLAHTGGNMRLARFLIESGARITAFAFMEALCHRGRARTHGFELAKLFLESGFDINTPRDGRAALHAASNSGAPEVVTWLLEHGADVNIRGRMNRTPLHFAAERNRNSTIVELLVTAGADTKAKDVQGRSALQIAEHHGKTAVADWLRKK